MAGTSRDFRRQTGGIPVRVLKGKMMDGSDYEKCYFLHTRLVQSGKRHLSQSAQSYNKGKREFQLKKEVTTQEHKYREKQRQLKSHNHLRIKKVNR